MRLSETYGFILVPTTYHNSPSYAPGKWQINLKERAKDEQTDLEKNQI